MSTLFSTAGIARLSARHPSRVIVVWAVILALAGVAASGLSKALTSSVSFTSTPESREGALLLQQRFGRPELATETVVVHSDTLTVSDPAFQQVVQKTTAALLNLKGVVSSAVNYYQAQATGSTQAATLVSADRHSTIIPVSLAGTFNDVKVHADEYMQTVESQSTDNVEVLTVGAVSTNQVSNRAAQKDLRRAEAITLPLSIAILVVVFGALVAAGVPLILSGVAIVTAIGLTALIGRLMDLSFFVVNMITMIGLAVGIDYTLFIISRYREERRLGLSRREAIQVSGATASKAVLVSGVTVCLALSGLLLLPATVFRSLGIGAVLVVLAALAAMLTLVPALISLIGDRINWPRRRRRVSPEAVPVQAEPAATGFWAAVSRIVMRRPIVSVTLATLFLLVLAIPVRDLQLGISGTGSIPDSKVQRAYTILKQQFSAGLLSPVEIVVDAPRMPETEAAINKLVTALQQNPNFQPAAQVQWNAANDLAEVRIPMASSSDTPHAMDVIKQLRHTLIPNAFAGTPAKVYVTGATALNLDFQQLVDSYTPYIFAYVLSLSFLLLLVAFRSIVVPIKAILMNLLSVGAAYGLMVLVFQKGYLDELFGFQQTPTIETWIPIFLFCVLFGLSMDYHVFLLSRIREHYDQTHDNYESVAVGLTSTARIITGAAVIMVVVFAGFASGRLVMLQQIGFGLAVAIFLDATLVRTIIVPSAMALLGDANWYLPSWLSWIPDLRIENLPKQLSPATAGAASWAPVAGAPAELVSGSVNGGALAAEPGSATPPVPVAQRVSLAAVGEPLLNGRQPHALLDVIAIALCATIGGAESFTEMETFAHTKREWLASFLELPGGVPSADVFSRVFAALDPARLEETFVPRIRALAPVEQRRAGAHWASGRRERHDSLSRVRAWVNGRHLLLGQLAALEEPRGSGALRETLQVLALDHTVVTIDTSAAQSTVALLLVEQGADYVAALNGSQEGLTQEIADVFSEAEAGDYAGIAHDYHEALAPGRGQSLYRRAWLISDPDYLRPLNQNGAWPELNSVGLVEWEDRHGQTVSRGLHYYLSSLPDDANRFAEAVRLPRDGAEGIDWLLDIVFSEEIGRVRVGHAAENLALLRRIAFQLLKREHSVTTGLRAKRLRAAWDERYLLTVLKG